MVCKVYLGKAVNLKKQVQGSLEMYPNLTLYSHPHTVQFGPSYLFSSFSRMLLAGVSVGGCCQECHDLAPQPALSWPLLACQATYRNFGLLNYTAYTMPSARMLFPHLYLPNATLPPLLRPSFWKAQVGQTASRSGTPTILPLDSSEGSPMSPTV